MLDQYPLNALQVLLNKARTYKLDMREKNFFDTASRKYYENPTTELLSFFLNPLEVHNLNTLFFNGLIDCIAKKVNKDPATFGEFISVETEVCTLDGKRIDLIIETTKNLLIFECKIYHIQNNPIKSYINYAKRRVLNTLLKPLYFVLSIDGVSEFQEDSWNGISYENLVYAVNNFIPSYKIDIQNKWFTFAKEFLNHLTNYYLKPLNMDNFNFIKDNASEIQKLFQISQQVFSQINDHIIRNLQTELQEKFSIRNYRPTYYNGESEYWFCNASLADSRWICPTLVINTSKKDLPSEVHLCIEAKSLNDDEFLQAFHNQFLNFKKQEKESIYGGIPYMRYTYSIAALDISEVSNLITAINQLILKFYPVKYNEESHSTTN